MGKRKYTGYGIIKDMQGHYKVVPINSHCKLASFHVHQRYIPCWCSECPDILFDLLVDIDVFTTEAEADYAYYIRFELN